MHWQDLSLSRLVGPYKARWTIFQHSVIPLIKHHKADAWQKAEINWKRKINSWRKINVSPGLWLWWNIYFSVCMKLLMMTANFQFPANRGNVSSLNTLSIEWKSIKWIAKRKLTSVLAVKTTTDLAFTKHGSIPTTNTYTHSQLSLLTLTIQFIDATASGP